VKPSLRGAAPLALLAACACVGAPGGPPAPWQAAVIATASVWQPAIAPPIGSMAPIPEAVYSMGTTSGEPDEGPPHQVRVAAFDMDLTEVTVVQYAQCVRARACPRAPDTIQFPGVIAADHELYDSECNVERPERQYHPINCVDWTMADTFCRWAGKRLPTEEEWEYAACGGNCDTAQAKRGGAGSLLNSGRWPFSNSVAATAPGAFGLYDMAGNVWEWTASAYCPYDRPDCKDARRVIRGGSWSLVDFLFVRLTDRSPADPANRNTNVGFRCARSSPTP
jgi:formylglycine-generating enzyme required for sulfatase activity